MLIPYVEHSAEVAFPGPVNCDGATLYMFVVAGQRDRLELLCDRSFNAPSDGTVEYAPLSNLLIVSLGHIARITSGSRDVGTLPESQLTIWMPVAAVRRHAGLRFAERVALFPAYMVVDSVFSLASGREAYGIFKSFGSVETPTAPPPLPPERFAVTGLGVQHFGGDNTPSSWPLLELRRDPAAGGTTGRPLEGPAALLAELRALLRGLGHPQLLPGLQLPISLVEDLAHRAMPMLTLKQIRSAGGLGADYQAIVETPMVFRRLRALQLLDPYDLALAPAVASFPLAEDLGLHDQRALLGFQVEVDFTIGDGRAVWQAGTPRPSGCLATLAGLLRRNR